MIKKILFLTCFFGTLAMVACDKEDDGKTSGIPKDAVMLSTEGFQGNSTKTSVDGLTVQWDGNSSETVNINGNNYEVIVSGDDAYIDPVSPISGSTVYGYYPNNIVANDGWETSTPIVTIPSNYDCHYTDGRQVIALPMAAYGTYDGTPTSIEFMHLTAAIKVMVRNEISSDMTLRLDKVVVSSSAYLLSGCTPVTLLNNGAPIVNAETTSSANSVTVNLTDHPVIPYSTGSDGNRIEVQVPIRPIGNGGNTPITVEVFAYEDGNPSHTYTFRKENVSVPTQGRNMMLTAGCRISNETGLVTEFNYLTTPLTFEAMTDNAIVTFTTTAEKTLEYSTDGSSWSTYTTPITLPNIGDKVSFRGDNTTMATAKFYSYFSCSEDCYIYGNIMSLLSKNDYATTTTLTANYTFRNLFYNNSRIFSHPSKMLALPATVLVNSCYQAMFQGCTHLTSAPALPAISMASSCYSYMFDGCTGLLVAPSLPATTLANNCYGYMFQGCTGLTSTPALPATTLADGCYQNMFSGCTGLISVTSLPATTLAEYCYSNMFEGCTSLTTAPDLPASTLVAYCYSYMFQNCSNLNSVKCLATTILSNGTYNWLKGVSAIGTFTKKSNNTSWTSGVNGIPSGWTVINVN